MQWIDFGLVTPTVAQLFSAATNCLFFWRYARTRASRARRVASLTLGLVCGVLALEALLFLAVGSLAVRDGGAAVIVATLLLRLALLGVTALLSLLIWRSPLRRA